MSAAVAKTAEPTMEEILASIRRIIADDQTVPAKPVAPVEATVSPASVAPQKPRLVEVAPVAPPIPPSLAAASQDWPPPLPPQLRAAETSPIAVPPAPAIEPVRATIPALSTAIPVATPMEPDASEPAEEMESTLISDAAGEAIKQSFGALAHTHLTQQLPPLEDIIRDMLRPMLKNWLDDNLPSIVEKLVRAEIERVARGGRG
jgi:hypothetical protein